MHDPGLRALRRALRTAIAAAIVFYFGVFVVDNEQFAVLAVFAVIGVNGLADFGGSNRSRVIANAALVLTGIPLVALGTWVSETTVQATICMFVVVFVVGYMGIYSGYVAAGANVVILFFVVSSAIPAPHSAIDDRLLGLLVGGLIAVPASVVWPLHERANFRNVLATATRATGDALACLAVSAADWPQRRDSVVSQVRALRPELAQMALRPAGPTNRDRAEIYVIYALGRFRDLIPSLDECHERLGAPERKAQLAALAAALAAAADTLDARGTPVDLEQLRRVIDEFAEASNRRLEQELTTGDDPADFAADADADIALRELGGVVLVVCINARVAVGRKVETPATAAEPGTPMLDPRDMTTRTVAWRRARNNFTLSSVVMRNTLRLAVALSLARLLVGIFDLQHGFWVVFATLTVMKSNAGSTRDTVVKAVTGTAIGFAAAAVLLTTFEGSHDIWLVIMPMLLFGAMYLAGRTVIASQAFFTTAIIALFRIMAPATWTLALLRLEDIAIGAAVGLLIGVFAWPQGAGGQLRASIAVLLDTGRRYAELTARRLISGAQAPHDVARARDETVAATHRTEDVFMQYLTETAPRRVSVETWATLMSSGLRLWYATDMIRLHNLHTGDGQPAPVCLDFVGLLEETTDRLDAGFAEAADALAAGTPLDPVGPIIHDNMGPAMHACTASLHHETDAERLTRFIRLVEVRSWLRVLSTDLGGLPEPVDEVAAKLGPAR